MIPITTGSRSAASANWSRSRGRRSTDSPPARRLVDLVAVGLVPEYLVDKTLGRIEIIERCIVVRKLLAADLDLLAGQPAVGGNPFINVVTALELDSRHNVFLSLGAKKGR